MSATVQHVVWTIRSNPITGVAAGGLAVLLVLAIFGPWSSLTIRSPRTCPWRSTAVQPILGRDRSAGGTFSAPDRRHPPRSDHRGLRGVVSFAAGTFIGSIAGYIGGRLDRIVGSVVDVLMAFPLFVMAMALVAALGNRVENIILATAFINLPFYIRFSRAEVNSRRGLGWVEAARACGDSHLKIILCSLVPNILPAMAIQVSLNLGWAILNAAGLSVLGLGITAPTAEWGIMVAEGARFILSGHCGS